MLETIALMILAAYVTGFTTLMVALNRALNQEARANDGTRVAGKILRPPHKHVSDV